MNKAEEGIRNVLTRLISVGADDGCELVQPSPFCVSKESSDFLFGKSEGELSDSQLLYVNEVIFEENNIPYTRAMIWIYEYRGDINSRMSLSGDYSYAFWYALHGANDHSVIGRPCKEFLMSANFFDERTDGVIEVSFNWFIRALLESRPDILQRIRSGGSPNALVDWILRHGVNEYDFVKKIMQLNGDFSWE